MEIRPYRAEDLEDVLSLFQDTVRTINRRDYTPEQVEAWAGRFELDLGREDVHAVASFMASGVVGLLGEQSGRACDERFDARLQTISEIFSAPAIGFARNRARDAVRQANPSSQA